MINTSKFLGIKFVNGGRSSTECDCWGLVMLVMQEFDKMVPDFNISCYDSRDIHSMKCFIEDKFIKTNNPDKAIIVAINLDRSHPSYTQHFGVCLNNRQFIHILEKHGVLISKIDDKFFKNIIAGYYSWNSP